MPVTPLPADKLRLRCDLSSLTFETTADLKSDEDVLGQDRAFEAIEFGIGIDHRGYNIFVLGPTGAGRHRYVRRIVDAKAASEPKPSDWCYIHNFDEPRRPKALELPTGMGRGLRQDITQLIEDLRAGIPAVFESDEYRNRRHAIDQEFRDHQESMFETIQKKASEKNIALIRTPTGLALAPVRDEEVIEPQAFQKLPEEERKRIESDIEELQRELQQRLQEVPRWDKDRREKVRELNRETTRSAVTHQIMALRAKYMEFGKVVAYLDAVEKDIIDNSARLFLEGEQEAPAALPMAMVQHDGEGPRRPELQFRRYEVNLFVDNSSDGNGAGAPVYHEDHPTLPNLIGRAEHQAELGALLTDFTLLRAGALHKANGGYLMLDAGKVLMQPYAWEELKRTLFAREIKIETPFQSYISTITLEPEPIPLGVKVVLIGDRRLYYMLAAADPEFDELFKIAADFEDDLERTDATVEKYAGMIAAIAEKVEVRPLDRSAVAHVIEHSSREAGDNQKLSARVGTVTDLLHESSHLAGLADRSVVSAADVQGAIDLRIRRADRIRTRSLEQIERGTILIDTKGSRVGTINGLSVLQIGGFAFGRPTRITARVRMGRGEFVDIEREVDLGGPTHSKGVLILSSYLGAHYAIDRPLSLRASLVFEQSYGGVDGDSASSTELYAILSALSGAPIRQGLAVTGSVNQYGEVQAIGGVNEKIEGFFDVCAKDGFTGDQGVLIPHSNVGHLMLRQDIVDAAAAGKFAIYPIATIDQGIEVLTGVAAGDRDSAGDFPDASINRLVEDRLMALADARRRFGVSGEGIGPG
ncbi:MAG: ATP-binding protein [Proteobacteria bacterium]|nr:ATP-binding protein [Pseudomonadota bacterium]MDA1058352.1 ATP-binding protein [Pseudomonadota bacterium]